MTKVQKQKVVDALKKHNGDSGPIEKTKAKAKEILKGEKNSSSVTKVGKSDLKESTVKLTKLYTLVNYRRNLPRQRNPRFLWRSQVTTRTIPVN
jgi:hypothetical protein